ncbi:MULTISPECIES: hypothetical protein [Pseudoalteromonas]|uniref:hypothetical protein n=1 Tax=Pseudoalteromonas TaxID=53246 RepID=UPI00249BF11F|nr:MULTISPECIES: hypothetical protein [Pseudoalteromonas]MDI3246899.1 hypothetical protein [Pseudoalteromonas agarivorans]WRU71757.1 CRISPR-associated protein Cas2 [Pseudoalteromonas sp. CuT 4-3]
MANNLIISYDLNSPGQDYEKIFEKIKSLGSWAKVQKSLWYVNSSLSAASARDAVSAVMDSNDSLIVIDSTNNNAAWTGINEEVATHMTNNWPS